MSSSRDGVLIVMLVEEFLRSEFVMVEGKEEVKFRCYDSNIYEMYIKRYCYQV